MIIKKIIMCAASVTIAAHLLSAADGVDKFAWFDDAKLGMFIHWGVYSVPARGEWVMNNEKIPPEEYAKFAQSFHPPASFSPEEWVLLAKRMGAKYVVLTTRHHDGFALWNTKTSDFNAYKYCGRDFVKEYADACRKHGLRVGFYYSIIDWKYRPRPDGTYEPKVWQEYLHSLHEGLRELMTNYGKVDVLWYDGCSSPKGSSPDIIDETLGIRALNRMARELQPGIILNDRSLIDGDYMTPEQSVEAPPRGRRWESCMTMNRNWGYCAKDHDWKDSEMLIRSLIHCARFGGNFLLNIGPRADGSVPEECLSRIQDIGDYIRRCPQSIYGAQRDDWTEAVHEAGPVTKANGYYYLHALNGNTHLDGVKTIEKAAEGIYRVEFRAGAKPARWLGGRHDCVVKAGDAPILGYNGGGQYDPEEGKIEPCADAEVQLPAAGDWKVQIGYVNAEGFKDTADFEFHVDAPKKISAAVSGARGYYARKISANWRVVAPKRWQVAGVFHGDFVGTRKYESIVKANDRDMLALAAQSKFVPVGAANDKATRPEACVDFSLSAPKHDFGYALAKTTVKAPRDGVYYAAAAFEYWGDVYVNGERIIRNPQKPKAEPQFVHFKPIAFPIRLKAGDNEILMVGHGGSGAHYVAFYLNLPSF